MSGGRTGAGAANRIGPAAGRVKRAWRLLPHERRLAAVSALALVLTLFLPWYQETVIATGRASGLQSASATITGWGAFSFVEAALVLVAAGVLILLFQRAEGRAFHLPGGDGWVVTAAGLWACLLVLWRIFDKQGTTSHVQYATTAGVEWGIFIALALAALLAYAGSRMRAAHRPEPPLPGEEPVPAPASHRPEPRPAARAATAGHRPEPRPAGTAPVAAASGRATASPPPVAAEEQPTRRLAVPGRAAGPDEQLTIPLEEKGPGG